MIRTLAAIPSSSKSFEDTGDAWRDYLLALADQLELANAQMVDAYDTMRDVLSSIDVPLLQTVADPGGVGYPTAWTKEQDQQFVDFNSIGVAVTEWLREGARGERTVFLQGGTWGLEQKDTDDFIVLLDPKTHLPYRAAAPPPAGLQGTLGAIHPALIVLGVIVQAVVLSGYLYVVYKAIMTVGDVARGIVDHQNTKAAYDCLDKHPVEECTVTHQNIIKMQQAVNAGRENAAKNPVPETAKALGELATTLLWVGLGGGLLYLGVKVVPPLVEEMSARKSHA